MASRAKSMHVRTLARASWCLEIFNVYKMLEKVGSRIPQLTHNHPSIHQTIFNSSICLQSHT